MGTSLLSVVLLLVSASLTPARTWYPPDQPISIEVRGDGELALALTEFGGRRLEPNGSADVEPGKTVDARQVFQQLSNPGTYVLYVTKRGAKDVKEFQGTPLVIGVRENRKRGAPPGAMVVKVEPLRYAEMTTGKGKLTMVFYYDVAPNTVASFLTLAKERYFDGLTFHRIVPDFVIQGGDPKGDGTGSPGFSVDAEFSDRPHEAGALSMARTGDPSEAPGVMPRSEFANSAGSQFFICLNYENTKQLDTKYTVFGKVTAGMDAVKQIAATPLEDPSSGKPKERQVIEKVEVKDVTAADNPYAAITRGNETVAPPTQRP
jgi:peptidyl-prolyl cis-trans isomerase B (cyclophilin B)